METLCFVFCFVIVSLALWKFKLDGVVFFCCLGFFSFFGVYFVSFCSVERGGFVAGIFLSCLRVWDIYINCVPGP